MEWQQISRQKYKGEEKCDSPSVSEEEIQGWGVGVINQVIGNKNDIINNVTAFDEKLFNTLIEKMVIYKNKKVAIHFKNVRVIEI